MTIEDSRTCASRLVARLEPEDQIRAVKASDQDQRILKPQLSAMSSSHLLGRGRRVGADRNSRQSIAQNAELAVFRAEIVAPHADAVRFVDGDRGNAERPDKFEERGHDQPLRRNIEDLHAPGRASR